MSKAKQAAAQAGAALVRDGMIVGLGSGSTSELAIAALGQRVEQGLKIRALSSSERSAALAKDAGIELMAIDQVTKIDLYLDGADEVREDLWLIKGGGGALTREKILATMSDAYAVLVDDSKWVRQFGKFPLPIEVLPFAVNFTLHHLEQLGLKGSLRSKDSRLYVTDNGNWIFDATNFPQQDVETLMRALKSTPGVVEAGLFPPALVSGVITGYADGRTETRVHQESDLFRSRI